MGSYPLPKRYLLPKSNVDCLKNFFNKTTNKANIDDFKSFMKSRYAKGDISPNHPRDWNNYNRQLNRVISYYNDGSSQARSGIDAWNKYLRDDLTKYIEYRINKELMEKNYIASGRFDGIYSNVDLDETFYKFYESRVAFNDFNDLIRAGALYMADVPAGIIIYCTKAIYVAKSSK
jgi:hypothetical protein